MNSNLPHGHSSVYWHGNVLVIKPSGAFNREGVQLTAQKIQQQIAARPQGDWARLYLFEDKDTLGTLESLVPFSEAIRHSKTLGCKFLICVGGNVLNKESIRIVCDKAGLPVKFCDNFEEGLEVANQAL